MMGYNIEGRLVFGEDGAAIGGELFLVQSDGRAKGWHRPREEGELYTIYKFMYMRRRGSQAGPE